VEKKTKRGTRGVVPRNPVVRAMIQDRLHHQIVPAKRGYQSYSRKVKHRANEHRTHETVSD